MENSINSNIQLNGTQIQQVNKFCYLGNMINNQNNINYDVKKVTIYLCIIYFKLYVYLLKTYLYKKPTLR